MSFCPCCGKMRCTHTLEERRQTKEQAEREPFPEEKDADWEYRHQHLSIDRFLQILKRHAQAPFSASPKPVKSANEDSQLEMGHS